MNCGWCTTDQHDQCKPYIIGPVAQIWWCECECDPKRQETNKEEADEKALSVRGSLNDEKPKRKRRKRTSPAV